MASNMVYASSWEGAVIRCAPENSRSCLKIIIEPYHGAQGVAVTHDAVWIKFYVMNHLQNVLARCTLDRTNNQLKDC